MFVELNALDPAPAGALVAVGAMWAWAAATDELTSGASAGFGAATAALGGPLVAAVLLPVAAMLTDLAGLLGEDARPIPVGLSAAVCLVGGGVLGALATAFPSLAALGWGAFCYLPAWMAVEFLWDFDGWLIAGVASAAIGVWAAADNAARLYPTWGAAALGPTVMTGLLTGAARVAPGPDAVLGSTTGVVWQVVAAAAASVAAAVYKVREVLRRRSRRPRRSAARAAQ